MKGCPKGEYREKTMKVGGFEPNARGLYDMHGNVWDWVNDWYGEYPSGLVPDPLRPLTGSRRVVRGCGWYFFAHFCRSAFRGMYVPGYRDLYLGLRTARSAK